MKIPVPEENHFESEDGEPIQVTITDPDRHVVKNPDKRHHLSFHLNREHAVSVTLTNSELFDLTDECNRRMGWSPQQ